MKDTTYLQGIGNVKGTPARTVKVGDHIVFNGGESNKVIEIVAETPAFVTFKLEYTYRGETRTWLRRFKKDRIVARPRRELEAA